MNQKHSTYKWGIVVLFFGIVLLTLQQLGRSPETKEGNRGNDLDQNPGLHLAQEFDTIFIQDREFSLVTFQWIHTETSLLDTPKPEKEKDSANFPLDPS